MKIIFGLLKYCSGGELQLSSSVPVHWTNSGGPDSKYRNNTTASITNSQTDKPSTPSTEGMYMR